MKIAVACNGDSISGHFGHCQQFVLFQVEDGKVVGKEIIANPGHKPGFLPVFLHEKEANVIVSGGMGEGAVNLFKEKNIEIVTGASGNVDLAVEKYLNGQLISNQSICNAHMHHGEGCNH